MAVDETYLVIVLGETWAAVGAACRSAKQGARTAIVSPTEHFGGCIANGLGAIDLGRHGKFGIGGPDSMSGEFFRRLTQYIGSWDDIYRVSPSMMERVCTDMLEYYGVYVRPSRQIDTANVVAKNTTFITCTNGDIFRRATNGVFIDCTEEGDGIFAAGIPTRTGRESSAEFGESLAGYHPVWSTFTPLDCYESPGVLLHGFSAEPASAVGDADDQTQAYTFRVCMTREVGRKFGVHKPAGYDESLFEYRKRMSPYTNADWVPISGAPCIDGKLDVNGDWGIPLQNDYPNASVADRETIRDTIYAEQAGFIWWLQNSDEVHPNVQDRANDYGLPTDEFEDSGGITQQGWPARLYTRVGRRLENSNMQTQNDAQVSITKSDTLAVFFYSLDNHAPRRIAVVVGGVPGFILDGFGVDPDIDRQVTPYEVGYTTGLPDASDSTNWLSGAALAGTAVWISSGRIDIQRFNFSVGLGLIAAMCAMSGTPIHSADVAAAQAILEAEGHVIHYTPPS